MSDYRAVSDLDLEPILTFRFNMSIDGIGTFELMEVSGLGYEIGVTEHEVVVDSTASLRKISAHLDYDEIEFTRPLSDDMTLYNWIKAIADGEGHSSVTKNGTITMFDISGSPVAEWKFESAWPISYSVSDLHISDGSVVTETMKITHEYLERTT